MERQRQHLKRVLQPLTQALEASHRSLEELESTLIEFEETLNEPEQRPEHPQTQQGGVLLLLLSISEVCQELGMGKSWVYRRIQSGEIPSVKLGGIIKVRREVETSKGAWKVNATSRRPNSLAEFFSLTEHLLPQGS